MKITEQVRQDIKDMAAAFDRGETLDRKEVILQKQKREGQAKDAWVEAGALLWAVKRSLPAHKWQRWLKENEVSPTEAKKALQKYGENEVSPTKAKKALQKYGVGPKDRA